MSDKERSRINVIQSVLDRLARSVHDAREFADSLQARGVKLALGTSIYDPADPMGKMFFNVLAMLAEFEGDLIRLRTPEGMAIARAKGKLRENSRSYRINNRKDCVGCMKVARTQSVIWLNYFQFRGQLFTGLLPAGNEHCELVMS